MPLDNQIVGNQECNLHFDKKITRFDSYTNKKYLPLWVWYIVFNKGKKYQYSNIHTGSVYTYYNLKMQWNSNRFGKLKLECMIEHKPYKGNVQRLV